jgi:two-component system OmpR family sensor kinase
MKVQERTAQLSDAMNKMGEARRLQDNFVAQVSHELRTPMTTLIGATATILRPELNAGADVRSLAESVARNADRMSRLVDNLLMASALSDGVPSAAIPFDVAAEVVALVGHFANTRKHFYVHASNDLPALGDPERARMILRQLLDNASKFAPDSTGVWIDVFPRGDSIEIVVADEGPGIPAEHAAKIFDRFYQIDGTSTRAHDGAGLGLFVARRLAESMNGRLELDETSGAGATFRFTLPACVRAPGAPGAPAPSIPSREELVRTLG